MNQEGTWLLAPGGYCGLGILPRRMARMARPWSFYISGSNHPRPSNDGRPLLNGGGEFRRRRLPAWFRRGRRARDGGGYECAARQFPGRKKMWKLEGMARMARPRWGALPRNVG